MLLIIVSKTAEPIDVAGDLRESQAAKKFLRFNALVLEQKYLLIMFYKLNNVLEQVMHDKYKELFPFDSIQLRVLLLKVFLTSNNNC